MWITEQGTSTRLHLLRLDIWQLFCSYWAEICPFITLVIISGSVESKSTLFYAMVLKVYESSRQVGPPLSPFSSLSGSAPHPQTQRSPHSVRCLIPYELTVS